jgi:hypothetical protein
MGPKKNGQKTKVKVKEQVKFKTTYDKHYTKHKQGDDNFNFDVDCGGLI